MEYGVDMRFTELLCMDYDVDRRVAERVHIENYYTYYLVSFCAEAYLIVANDLNIFFIIVSNLDTYNIDINSLLD